MNETPALLSHVRRREDNYKQWHQSWWNADVQVLHRERARAGINLKHCSVTGQSPSNFHELLVPTVSLS